MKKEEIKVNRVSRTKFEYFDEGERGKLVVGELKKQFMFKIKRFFYISQVGSENIVRGEHAHKDVEQIIICIQGNFVLELDDGTRSQKFVVSNPSIGIKIGRLVWLTMSEFSEDCIILVLANENYSRNDYIEDYDEFCTVIG